MLMSARDPRAVVGGQRSLLFAGRDLLQGLVLLTWGLTFAGTTTVVVLGVSGRKGVPTFAALMIKQGVC